MAPKPRAGGTPISPTSPGMDNVDAQVDELQALVRQSREEQAIISSKILALKSGGLSQTPGLHGKGYGTVGVPQDEVNALREQLAETDSLLLEKDAEVERLRAQVKTLLVQVQEPKTAASWRQRYEDAQRRLEACSIELQGVNVDHGKRKREVFSLQSYLRILEVDKETNQQQRERLLTDAKTAREALRVNKVERDTLGKQLREFEEGFLRCISRVTQSLAAGVSTVVLNDKAAIPRFVVLRMAPGGEGVIEIFDEPHAHDEILSIDVAVTSSAKVEVDKTAMTILITYGSNKERSRLRIVCIGQEEYMKWTGALKLIGHRTM